METKAKPPCYNCDEDDAHCLLVLLVSFISLLNEKYKTPAMAGGIGVGGGSVPPAEEKVLRLLLMAAMITPPAPQTCTVQLVRTRDSVGVVRQGRWRRPA